MHHLYTEQKPKGEAINEQHSFLPKNRAIQTKNWVSCLHMAK